MKDQFAQVLELCRIQITKFDPKKTRPIGVSDGNSIDYKKLSQKIMTNAGPKLAEFPEVVKACLHIPALEALVEAHAEKHIASYRDRDEARDVTIPEHLASLTLNVDPTASSRELKFFCSLPNQKMSKISGSYYMRACGMKEVEALAIARPAIQEYLPRESLGTKTATDASGETHTYFNTYIPPSWMEYTEPLPDKLPYLFEKLINHLLPIPRERKYFFAWLYESLTNRAFVYLVLCGAPGIGKNRLKLVMRALHGHENTVDGKSSTFKERFNSQLFENTLTWFDELSYNLDMENQMKEVQNDSISKEMKGFDATRSTKVHASLVISNNKPRDNYIAFDARKFSPLFLNKNKLYDSMTSDEVTELTQKVEKWDSDTYDIAFIAQIGRWILKHGYSSRWPYLEYKGPMFYRLAHTSMTKWQKRAVAILTMPEQRKGPGDSKIVFTKEKGFQWSTVQEFYSKKTRSTSDSMFPDYSSIRHFFDHFVDSHGHKVFETTPLKGDIMSDFFVKQILSKVKILTEDDVMAEIGDVDDENIEEVLPNPNPNIRTLLAKKDKKMGVKDGKKESRQEKEDRDEDYL